MHTGTASHTVQHILHFPARGFLSHRRFVVQVNLVEREDGGKPSHSVRKIMSWQLHILLLKLKLSVWRGWVGGGDWVYFIDKTEQCVIKFFSLVTT